MWKEQQNMRKTQNNGVPGNDKDGWDITFVQTQHKYHLNPDGKIDDVDVSARSYPTGGAVQGTPDNTGEGSGSGITPGTGNNDDNTGGGSGDAEDTTAPDDLQKYLLSPELTGRPLFDILNTSTVAFVDKDDEGSITSASTKVKFLNQLPYVYDETTEDGIKYAIYVKYNNVAYKVMTKGSGFTTDPAGGVTKIYEPKSGTKEGTIVQYSANGSATKTDWLVLYDNGSTLDIMSVDTMGSLTLGSKDTTATNVTNDSNENVGKAINSYNNAYTRINNYCKSLVTNTTAQKVRSVGSKPDFSTTDTTATYSSTNLSTWASRAYNNVGKTWDANAESDVVRMSYYDLADSQFGYAKSNADYWLASRVVYEYSSNVYFNVRIVNSAGNAADGDYLWRVNSSGASSYHPSCAVRPVVRVASSDVS